MKIRAGVILLSLIISACASGDGAVPEATVPLSMQTAVPLASEGLPPQRLEAGQCGLFLWDMATPRRFTFFSLANSGRALMLHENRPLELVATAADGDIFGTFLTDNQYLSDTGEWSVQLTLTPGPVLEGGQRVDAGRVVIRGADDWETIVPVTGALTCLPG